MKNSEESPRKIYESKMEGESKEDILGVVKTEAAKRSTN